MRWAMNVNRGGTAESPFVPYAGWKAFNMRKYIARGEHVMKKFELVRDVYKNPDAFADKTVSVAGWIRTIRSSKAFGFIELNDGTFFKNIQIVFEENLENFEEIKKLGISASISVEGKLLLTPDAKQAFEIKADSIEVQGESEKTYPLQKKRHTFEYLRTIAHLRPRSNTFSAVFRVRSLVSYAIHKFFQDRGFVYVHTPIITGSDCEGAGEMFRVTTLDLNDVPKDEEGKIDYESDFFGKESNLTVSGQLEAEIFALAFRNVYTFGPTFRAENSNTTRHASEFWMIEPEIAFCNLDEMMDIIEDFIKYLFEYALEEAAEEMEFFDNNIEEGRKDTLEKIIKSTFARITYTKAIDILKDADQDFEFPVEWGMDLQTEHERYLTENHFKKPVLVTDYPKGIKAFYMRINDDNKTVAAVDCLVPEVGEIIGGSQREERYDVLKQRMKEENMEIEKYDWFLDIRKYGTVPHSGFGLGFERILMYMSGINNIRDIIPFPRTPGNAKF